MIEAKDYSFRVTRQVQYLSISHALPGRLPELPSLGTSRKTTVKAPEYLPDLPKLPVPSSAASNKDYDASSLLACEVNKPILFVFMQYYISQTPLCNLIKVLTNEKFAYCQKFMS